VKTSIALARLISRLDWWQWKWKMENNLCLSVASRWGGADTHTHTLSVG